jgi:hypothetical protein
MAQRADSQLGFDFDGGAAAGASSERASLQHAWTGRTPPAPSTPPPLSLTPAHGADSERESGNEAVAQTAPLHERPVRGRAAMRARAALLLSRLQEHGLRGIEAIALMRTRTVMVSLIGRTLRVHEGYVDAPDDVLRAIVTFSTTRTRAARAAAKEVILAYDVERAPAVRRIEQPRPGDMAIVASLQAAHRELNAQWFEGKLQPVALRVSGRMASRLGHYDPGSRFTPPEIALSRTHVVKHGWREALHTLLHEMVHQWQHETGVPVDHGPGFRRKCREVGITPAARRDVLPLVKRQRRRA